MARPILLIGGVPLNTLSLLLAAAFSSVFLLSAVSKVHSRDTFDEFADSLAQFGIASWSARRLIGASVVGLEFALGIGTLAFPLLQVPRSWSAAVPFTGCVFVASITVALVVAKRSNGAVACHCFGGAETTSLPRHLAGNSVLVAVGLYVGIRGVPSDEGAGDLVLWIGTAVIATAAVLYGGYVRQALSTSAL